MILVDTHVWIWWVQGDKLNAHELAWLDKQTLCISIISCWEVAKLVENKKLQLPYPTEQWLSLATQNLKQLDLTLPIIVDACQLPQPFHKDPADQLITATARVHDIPLITYDSKMTSYPYVKTIKPCTHYV